LLCARFGVAAPGGCLRRHPLHDAYWIAGGLLGGIAGQVRFRAFYIRIVSSRTLAHFPATYGSTLVAAALVALSFIDSLSAFRRVPVVPPQYVSGGASVCAWFLCSRAWSAAVQVLAISKSTGNPP
jgi:hypothetical protein